MIRIHHFPNGVPDSPDYGEDTLWGTLQDGEIIAVDEDAGPEGQSFEEFVAGLEDLLLSGTIDPIEVTDELNYGRTRAVVPSDSKPGTYYTGDRPELIGHDGQLGTIEQYELDKYFTWRPDETAEPQLFKEYELSRPYKVLIVYSRDHRTSELREVGRIDLTEREVLSIQDDGTFEGMLRFLKTVAPTLNPIPIVEHNSRTRVSAVVNPDADPSAVTPSDQDALIMDPNLLKRDPNEIQADVNRD